MRVSPLLAFLLALGCAGSQKPEDKVIGSWTGDPPGLSDMRKDPQMSQFAGILADTVRLEIKPDHTYRLDYFESRIGTWKLIARAVKFEETSVESHMPFDLGDQFQFGTASQTGQRAYTAVLSADDNNITLLMGRLGEVEFHR